MSDALEFVVSELLENDIESLYQSSLNSLSNKYSRLKNWKTASKVQEDALVLEATKIVVDAAIQFDFLSKQSNFEKESGLITNIMLKTLKIAQKILAGLLLKSPLKIGIAYNAMHNAIKFLEKGIKKKLRGK